MKARGYPSPQSRISEREYDTVFGPKFLRRDHPMTEDRVSRLINNEHEFVKVPASDRCPPGRDQLTPKAACTEDCQHRVFTSLLRQPRAESKGPDPAATTVNTAPPPSGVLLPPFADAAQDR